MENARQPFPSPKPTEKASSLAKLVPYMALENDNLLYSVFALSATHILREGQNTELLTARHNYMGLALREQRNAVANLNKHNADAVCFSSTIMLIQAFAMLHERIVEPYSPPMDWLRLGRGAGTVFELLLDNLEALEGADASKFMLLVRGPPLLDDDDELFSEENRAPFLHLLEDSENLGQEIDGLWNSDIQRAYETTLSYIGSIHRAIERDEPSISVCRRLMAFPIRIPKLFIDLVEEQRPRALVILAHFFALTNHVNGIWWLANTPQREIRGVYRALPAEWKHHMHWSLSVVGLTSPGGFSH
ncbi:hypothetical protein L228DRAFT_94515 [Xylona heveae TC161]|uniref:C6 transcription factor n=1 Tax=Xylona heveae (strain CBS 132557 / TC161) TaxID=1328760 RepID=A0A165I3K6_XYLHT|nr:hypothetical protein L228DRAFT_94515 [Xylona heveae TC161]KZF24328.1 hypothetical protein L228DRAFT_94515 [Xylona heveae TC161]